MKTLVIHPADPTTDFLKPIYENNELLIPDTIVNGNMQHISKSRLKKLIKEHDRIIMMGHGTPYGLLGYMNYLIDDEFVYLLREKQCIYIWCNADRFVKKYGLHGFYTGMIISELEEARYCNVEATQQDVDEANSAFTFALKSKINSLFLEDINNIDEVILKKLKTSFPMTLNKVIQYNKQNLYRG